MNSTLRVTCLAVLALLAAADHCPSGGGGHHMRRLDHSAGHHNLVGTYKCSSWTRLIENYTVADGGSYVKIFSDNSTEAMLKITISLDGAKLNQEMVKAHLHTGACTASPVPAFVGGVRANTAGGHWMLDGDSNKEIHFMANTTTMGMVMAKTCANYTVDQTAKSIVVHESHSGAVVGMGARKLCCDLTYTVAPDPAVSDNTSSAGFKEMPTAVPMIASLLMAALLAVFQQ